MLRITNSKEQKPSWKVNSHTACQEVPRLYGARLLRKRVHNSPPFVSILS
jgi:hypothetical protein